MLEVPVTHFWQPCLPVLPAGLRRIDQCRATATQVGSCRGPEGVAMQQGFERALLSLLVGVQAGHLSSNVTVRVLLRVLLRVALCPHARRADLVCSALRLCLQCTAFVPAVHCWQTSWRCMWPVCAACRAAVPDVQQQTRWAGPLIRALTVSPA
ncbi:hypothetical protein ABPG75_003286 [Micractinium tetrahymenae]